MTAEVGADAALPTAFEIMAEVDCGGILCDPVALHAAILARRDWHDHASKLLTQWAELVRARAVEQEGSQREAAAKLGVGRRTVRPRNSRAKQ